MRPRRLAGIECSGYVVVVGRYVHVSLGADACSHAAPWSAVMLSRAAVLAFCATVHCLQALQHYAKLVTWMSGQLAWLAA